MEVELSDFAEYQLKRIYSYYKSVASEKVAQNLKEKILAKVLSLETFPYRGQSEINLEGDYRYVIQGNYKIIYKVKENTVFITDIFDTRQDPEKMKRTQ